MAPSRLAALIPPATALAAAILTALAAGVLAAPAAAQERKLATLQGIPSATVAPGGLGFVSLGWTDKGEFDRFGRLENPSDSLAAGLGFGSAVRNVGVQATVITTRISDEPLGSGFFDLKASRMVADGSWRTFVGAGITRLGGWGNAELLDPEGFMAVTSAGYLTFGTEAYPVLATVGYGTAVRDFVEDGVYGGVGIGLTPNFGLSLAFDGDELDLGSAFRIGALENVAVSATVNDVLDDDKGRRVAVSLTFFATDLF